MKKIKLSLPYFNSVHSIVALPSKDGLDHGYIVFCAYDPMAGHDDRYSVFKINCKTGHTSCHGRELDFPTTIKVRDKVLAQLIKAGHKKPQILKVWY